MALESAKASEVEVGEQSKPAPFNIDDPQNINSFLTAMKISIASPQPEPAHNTISQNAPTTESSELADAMGASEDKESFGAVGDSHSETSETMKDSNIFRAETSEAVVDSKTFEAKSGSHPVTDTPTMSPVRGTAAPPPTAAIGGVTAQPAIPSLEPIVEDGSDILRTIANSSNLKLHDSRHAPRNYKGGRIPANTTKHTGLPISDRETKYTDVPALRSPRARSFLAQDTKHPDTKSTKLPPHSDIPAASRNPSLSLSSSFILLDTDKVLELAKQTEQGATMTQYEDDVIRKFVTENSPATEKKEANLSAAAQDSALDVAKETSPDVEDKGVDLTTRELTDKVTQSTVESPASVKTPLTKIKSEDEDREHMTHFQSWGSPLPRNRPTARIRKVILSNLPSDADLTLVQSLVFGGAIETFHLSPAKTTAYVTFVNADACDAYFNAYPNGLVFKNPKTRRNHVVYIDKGKDVDVVSGIMQAYLDCQASRVVRATGADEDWGMRALYKLAEAKNRKVETIIDTYRDQVRTIIFRFTNIADAVGFRGQLMRDAAWEMCNVQFMDDPVAAATGPHLEE